MRILKKTGRNCQNKENNEGKWEYDRKREEIAERKVKENVKIIENGKKLPRLSPEAAYRICTPPSPPVSSFVIIIQVSSEQPLLPHTFMDTKEEGAIRRGIYKPRPAIQSRFSSGT